MLKIIPDRPISFEVFADDFPSMEDQAREIASWGDNVYVKIPVTNTKGEFAGPLIATLSRAGVKLNVTAMMTLEQVSRVGEALAENVPAVVSVFAGRIADTGRDPVPHMAEALQLAAQPPEGGAVMGKPERSAEHLPGRCDRLPHHHRHQRPSEEARSGRQGPPRLFARDRGDVLHGREDCGLSHPASGQTGRVLAARASSPERCGATGWLVP